jgi:hypothetical protein
MFRKRQLIHRNEQISQTAKSMPLIYVRFFTNRLQRYELGTYIDKVEDRSRSSSSPITEMNFCLYNKDVLQVKIVPVRKTLNELYFHISSKSVRLKLFYKYRYNAKDRLNYGILDHVQSM